MRGFTDWFWVCPLCPNGFDYDALCDLRNDPEEMRYQAASPEYHAKADEMRAARLWHWRRRRYLPRGERL